MKTDGESRDHDGREPGAAGFAPAFAAALAARGMTLVGLRDRLAAHGNPVSLTTLSYWRRGIRHPEGLRSLDAVADIERILGLDQGALLARRRASRRPGAVGRPVLPYADREAGRKVMALRAALGFDEQVPVRELTVSMAIDVGADGRLRRQSTRALVQCVAGTVTSIPYAEVLAEPSTEGPEFRVVAGGTLGASLSDEEGRAHVVIIDLEDPLTSPETLMLEIETIFPPAAHPSFTVGYESWARVREALIWVRFDPRRLPSWVEESVATPEGTSTASLPLVGSSVHLLRRGFGPGQLTVRWGFDDRSP